jgi:hypothetical protein
MNLIAEVSRKATRKLKYPCFACALNIIKDDDYVKQTYAFDGRVYSLNTHLICQKALLPEIEPEQDGLSGYYLINYYDTAHDTTPEWQEWYRQRKENIYGR